MADKFLADHAVINAKVQEFEKTHHDLDGMLTRIQSEADFLTGPAVWQGAAANAFQQFMDSYAQQAKKMNNELMDTAEKLRSVGNQVQQHDEEHAQQVSKAASSLQGL
jgi:WXG100 family type VII secretion target